MVINYIISHILPWLYDKLSLMYGKYVDAAETTMYFKTAFLQKLERLKSGRQNFF